ncbi:nucleolar and coiled-body phosphoprotein 1-like [Acanthaster planci]|uniref:Nucleolar and coiled-body phosphoprotein 1-like n=1 Tax=Acanthaster planci TaxID=133434 RepID=A0A8B7XMP2_ACAPL|nr:nucleolar and coiled-body phosphoprotein 1-like [Acanthaster planci]
MGRGYTADTSESPLGRDGGTVPCQVSDIGGASQKLGGPHAEHHSPLFKVKTLKDYLNALQQKSICGCKKCVHKIVFWPSGDCVWDHHTSKRERKAFLDTVYRGLNNQNCTRVEEADTCKREDEIRMQNLPKCGDDRRGASEKAAGVDQVEEEKLKLERGEKGDATQETRQEKGPNDSETVKLNNAGLEENKIADAAEDGERSGEDEDAVRWKEDPKEKGMKDLRPEKTVKESGDAEFHTGMQESADKEGENEAEEAGDGVPDENDVGEREASLKARGPGSGKAGHLDFESVGAEPEDYNGVIEEEPETDAADGEVSQLDSNPAAGRQGGENEAADLNESSLREACDVQSQSFKPRRVTGEKGEVETSAPPNQNIGGQGKAAETGQVVNYTGCALRMTGGNGDKDDDDDKKKPRPSDPLKTRLDCDRPARKKGRKGKKESRSPSAEEVKWEATGAKPKKVPRGPKIVSGPELLRQQELEKKMRGLDLCSRRDEHKEGPAGDAGRARHQALTAHLSLTSSPGRSALPHNSHNQQAVRRLYLDNGAQAKHGVVLKGILCGPPRAARPASRMEVGQGAEASPLAEAPVPRGTAAGDGPPPAGVPPEVEIPPGVSHGEPRSLIVLAERFGQLKLTDAAELQGQHEGVLLDRELKPMNHQYLEGDQYIKLLFLGRGSFGDVYLVQDTASDKKVVVKRELNTAASVAHA